jgi:uncharacterized membrane-anchored protein
MGHPLATVAVGGMPPALTPGGWDGAPLVLTISLILLLRWARFHLRFGVLVGVALLGGLAIDLIDDAIGISLATAVALLALTFTVVAVWRARADGAGGV